MRWVIRGVVVIIVLLVIALGSLTFLTFESALRPLRPVGFQEIIVPVAGGKPLAAAIWYPAQAKPHFVLLGFSLQQVARDAPVVGRGLPLVVISHGNGGGPGSHVDTALALAQAGFIVVAPMHAGDNYADQSGVGGPAWLISRAKAIPATIDYMLSVWPAHAQLDPRRIGIFGFSAGGFTALVAIGGEPDLARIGSHCASHPEFACTLWQPRAAPLPEPDAFARDKRIRAAVIAAPGYAFAFIPGGLAKVTVPIQLWAGKADVNVPIASNTGLVRDALGRRAEFHAVPGAGHFAFLAPCGPIGPSYLCRDAQGFDRRAFHLSLNAEVVRFFAANI